MLIKRLANFIAKPTYDEQDDYWAFRDWPEILDVSMHLFFNVKPPKEMPPDIDGIDLLRYIERNSRFTKFSSSFVKEGGDNKWGYNDVYVFRE